MYADSPKIEMVLWRPEQLSHHALYRVAEAWLDLSDDDAENQLIVLRRFAGVHSLSGGLADRVTSSTCMLGQVPLKHHVRRSSRRWPIRN